MRFDPIGTSNKIRATYVNYLKTIVAPTNESLRAGLDYAIDSESGNLVKGPYVQVMPGYQKGRSIADLVTAGILSEEFLTLDSAEVPVSRPLYVHQATAIEKAHLGRNLVVATGTGSGKTESFLFPILDHLLRQRASGELGPGVRALLLYPMNALANDQLKRLRAVLANAPDITFGRYTGETEEEEDRARDKYLAEFPGEPILPNEILSRKAMRENPPHILLTNYSMLEYLLLRPKDIALFSGVSAATWQFCAVDEAHVYDGATGAEVGFLLRRLRERVALNRDIQCIATSATIGSNETDAAVFASNLFGVQFEHVDSDSNRQDVITPTHPIEEAADVWGDFPSEILDVSLTGEDALARFRAAGFNGDSLYDALAGSETGIAFKKIVSGATKTLSSASVLLFPQIGENQAESRTARLIELAGKAKNSSNESFATARYHLFARATEGAFTCLSTSGPHVTLARHYDCEHCQSPAFELAACKRCGEAYLVGTREAQGNGQFQFRPQQSTDERLSWLAIGDFDQDAIDEDDLVLDVDDNTATVNKDVVTLCTNCGRMVAGQANLDCCSNPSSVEGIHIAAREIRKCVRCNVSMPNIVRRFESGNDATISVITTALYQDLPGEESSRSFSGNRKLLVFSDSRQQAAYFAPYLEGSYERFLTRSLIWRTVNSANSSGLSSPSVEDLRILANQIAEEHALFEAGAAQLTKLKEVSTWLQSEIVSLDENLALEGVGLLTWKLPEPPIVPSLSPLLEMGFSEPEARDVMQILARTLHRKGIIAPQTHVDLNDEIFAPRKGLQWIRGTGSEQKAKIASWLPTGAANNSRKDFLTRLFAKRQINVDVLEVLSGTWEILRDQTREYGSWLPSQNKPGQGVLHSVNPNILQATRIESETLVWRCDECRKISPFNVSNICPTFRCNGVLVPWLLPSVDEDTNHYRALYRTMDLIPMTAKEHTAQWTSREAARIQQEFLVGTVNVLSCSTTFELGVDVGDLQSVVLRNVPPSISNYIQRAGRTGRRSDNAAFVLTYAQRRPHDLAAFRDPRVLVDGKVRTPIIPIENARLAQRHIFSIALAVFLLVEQNLGREFKNAAEFLAVDNSLESAAERFSTWLDTIPNSVTESVSVVINGLDLDHEYVSTTNWVEKLKGLLSDVQSDFLSKTALFGELKNEAAEKEQYKRADALQRVLNNIEREELIGLLANGNVIPKYGFPVDTVEIKIPETTSTDALKLDLSRDLSQAIFEYAPGSSFVAAGKVWKSVGLAKQRERELPQANFRICTNCEGYEESFSDLDATCIHCGAAATGVPNVYVEPRFGFVADGGNDRPGETPPRTKWNPDIYVAADGEVKNSSAIASSNDSELTIEIMERTTLVRLNRSVDLQGFRICSWCGFGVPHVESWPTGSHRHPYTGKPCTGPWGAQSLGHKYQTDTVRISFPIDWEVNTAKSVLSAVLQGACSRLQIAPDNVTGTFQVRAGKNASLQIIDAVPGGAGYAKLIGENVEAALQSARDLIEHCECGVEAACYQCLLTYRNQRDHASISRESAIRFLERL